MADELDKEKLLSKSLLSREAIYRHIAQCKSQSLSFQSGLWAGDEELQALMKKNPRLFHALERSSYFWLQREMAEQKKEPEPADAIDIEKLEEMNLSDERLKELAGIKEKK